jgi:uncharacterized membrane protein
MDLIVIALSFIYAHGKVGLFSIFIMTLSDFLFFILLFEVDNDQSQKKIMKKKKKKEKKKIKFI